MSWVTNADVAAAIMARNLYKKVIYRDGVPGADALDRLVYGITSRAKVIKDYWNHIYETTVYEYNPLENYNMVEDTVHGHVLTRSGAISHTGTDTLVKTGKIKDGGKTTQRQFPVNNGGDAKDYAQTEDSRTTEYDYATDTRTLNTSDGDSRVDTNSGTDTMTRSGNIGVTTSQQMIQSEREITLKILEDYVADLADEFFTNYM